jgi:hypothetical protein
LARLNLYDIYETQVYPRLEMMAHWRSMGSTEKQVAKMCGITVDTLKRIMKKYPDVDEAMKNSKAELQMRIEKTLFMKALEGDKVCIIFALKNLDPTHWRDVHQVENKNEVNIINDLDQKLLEEAEKVKAKRNRDSRLIDEVDMNEISLYEEAEEA